MMRHLDRHDTKLFHLLCPTPVGGLPLGVILTSIEDEKTIDAVMSLFQTILPNEAVFRRGPKLAHNIIMTGNATAERNAILNNWPAVVLLLCLFNLLQALEMVEEFRK